MGSIIILGGGVCGLAGAVLLARDGHDVTVLERDPAAVPETLEDAWERWERGGVAQFRQAHLLHARAREVLDQLPDVRDALLAAGATRLNALARLPPSITDREPRPGDERMNSITARRPVVEYVFARAAAVEPRVDVRRGVAVAGLVAAPVDGRPHVSGVRTEAGEELRADLVVEATGRGSKLPRWLAAAGSEPVPEEVADGGFIYYSRFFRGDARPEPRAPFLSPLGTFSLLTLPGDRDTWSVTAFISAGDRPLKGFRHERGWTAAIRACPLHAHWLDGEPMTGVDGMGGTLGRRRRLVADGRPIATGIVAGADAWASTNPSLGRGISLGLVHMARLRDVAREHLGDPAGLALAFDAVTEGELTPWYRATLDTDRARLVELDALRRGESPPAPQDGPGLVRKALPVAMAHDAEVFRAGMEITNCLALPADVFARPGLAERVLAIAREVQAQPLPAPDREQLVGLLS